MKDQIQSRLSEIEQKHKVKILYACESGSRAWGFPSPDSDYDVRFIYIRPWKWYISVSKKSDIIDLAIKDNLDIAGWDLKKALNLFKNSNVSLYEWLQSPMIYMDNYSFREKTWQLSPDYFSPRVGLHHYLGLAKNFINDVLAEDEVRIKKYFYAIRSILACKWIIIKEEIPPMELSPLIQITSDPVQHEIQKLVDLKKNYIEKQNIERILKLDTFLKTDLDFCLENRYKFDPHNGDPERIDSFFREWINEMYILIVMILKYLE